MLFPFLLFIKFLYFIILWRFKLKNYSLWLSFACYTRLYFLTFLKIWIFNKNMFALFNFPMQKSIANWQQVFISVLITLSFFEIVFNEKTLTQLEILCFTVFSLNWSFFFDKKFQQFTPKKEFCSFKKIRNIRKPFDSKIN